MPALYVAHFGHPLLKGAKHWSFLLPIPTQPGKFTALQITGSTYTYEIKDPETVDFDTLQNFMGMAQVGQVDETKRKEFEEVCLSVPVTRGNLDWNCQNWIIEALKKAKENGFDVVEYKLEELQETLANVKV